MDAIYIPDEAVAFHKEACDVISGNIIFVMDSTMTPSCEPKVDFHKFRQGCCSNNLFERITFHSEVTLAKHEAFSRHDQMKFAR